MSVIRRRRVLQATASAALVARPVVAVTPNWPDRPVRIVVPYPPGAFNDALGRLIADQLPRKLGQPVVVDNRPGASGALGTAQVARATPDGYTISVANTPILTINPFILANPGYDPVQDFAPLAICARQMAVIVVPVNSPIRSVGQLVDTARGRPGQLTYGSAGPGSSNHLGAELLSSRVGISMLHVPYRGGNQHVLDLIAGRLDMMIDILSNVLPSIQGGDLRALAVTGNERDPSLPDIPTVQELGIDGFEMYVWFGFVAPARVPEDILDRLSGSILEIIRDPVGAEQLRQRGAPAWPRNREQFSAVIREDLAKWGTVIRNAGIQAG